MCRVASNGARLVDQVIQRQLLPILSIELLEAGHRGDHIERITVDCPEDVDGFTFAAAYANIEETGGELIMAEAV